MDPERKAKVAGAVARIVDGGATLGRPHVDVIQSWRLRKLNEARIDRGVRLLFAFDSNQNPVMLVGGDKTGKWNRWYPQQVKLAQRLYIDHERSIGKETRWMNDRRAGKEVAAEESLSAPRAEIYRRTMEAQERIAKAVYKRGVSHAAVLAALDALTRG